MKKYLYFVLLFAAFACSEEDLNLENLTVEQRALLGTAVKFDASIADEFTTRTTWEENGNFNEGDMMRIYRQYYQTDNGSWGDESWRTYYFYYKTAPGVSISLGKDWRVMKDRKGYNSTADALHPAGEFPQTPADSLTWDNGKIVRFRAWSRSNYAGALNSSSKEAYYPDYCVSDWVTVSGPTLSIPLVLKHQTCRIGITPNNYANVLRKVVMCTEWEDYKRKDNADTNANDNSGSEAGKTDEQAKAECDAVLAAYNRMCMPAGVDITTALLYGMSKSFYEGATAADLQRLEEKPMTDFVSHDAVPPTFYKYGMASAEYIKQKIQRPLFNSLNGSGYMLSIPYDMSNGPTKGEPIVLPACTRFRVYLYDVNKGDGKPNSEVSDAESTYHIFCLGDITDNSGNPMFPNGLELKPGYSYKFRVGYRYNQLTVTAEDHFSWAQQDAEEALLQNQTVIQPVVTTSDYAWWKNTIMNAIPKGTGGFNPEFHITNEKQFLEFLNLVNGTAATKTSGLARARRSAVNPEKVDANGDPKTTEDRFYWWYDEAATAANIAAGRRDTVWVTKTAAEAEGYLFYENYHAKDGNNEAYSDETYLTGAYSFYNQALNAHFKVVLDKDLDLKDWALPSIGNTADTPFRGYFDGYSETDQKIHSIANVNMQSGYLFNYIQGAAIRNLQLETTHPLGLVNQGTDGNSIVGISLLANSAGCSLAESLTGGENKLMSYVIGCIHVGDATGALVGTADNLTMLGCMNAAAGISGGALLGAYASGATAFFAPQIRLSNQLSNKSLFSRKPVWRNFHCNYYDTELSKDSHAVGSTADDYSPLEYIRGRRSGILKAKNDQLLSGETNFGLLTTDNQRLEYYGLAPWKAMNYAIRQYNSTTAGSTHPCKAHFISNTTGYSHRYPELVTGAAGDGDGTGLNYSKINPLNQQN